MNDADNGLPKNRSGSGDELGELIRGAGPRPKPPADHYASVLASSRAAWKAKVAARKRRLWAYAAAASLAALVGAGAIYQVLPPATPMQVAVADLLRGDVAMFSAQTGTWRPLTDPGASVHAGNLLRTAATGRASLTLTDGSSLRINGQTELWLLQAGVVRLVAGAIYVDSNDTSPEAAIRIETPFGIVRDIGTQFEVLSTAESLRLRVRSGRVEISRAQRGSELRGAAGEQLEITTVGAVQRSRFPPQHEDWAWAQSLAVVPELANRSVLGHFTWIARETGRELRFDSDRTERRAAIERWVGEARDLTPLQVLEAIAATTDFSYEFTSDGALLVARNAVR